MVDQEQLKQIFGPELAASLKSQQSVLVAKDEIAREEFERLSDLAQGVLDNDEGRALLQELVNLFFRPAVYPPPPGKTAGEYAAECEGRRSVVSLLLNLTHETKGKS